MLRDNTKALTGAKAFLLSKISLPETGTPS
jgi:hypothetical protein